jgi:hypothetical protein
LPHREAVVAMSLRDDKDNWKITGFYLTPDPASHG